MVLAVRKIHIKSFKGIEDIEVSDCGPINALVGKNNSGKSSVLHAIEMASLALVSNDWQNFSYKLDVKDMFSDLGNFEIIVTFDDLSKISVKSEEPDFRPKILPGATPDQKLKSILITPDPGANILQRRHKTPKQVSDAVKAKQFAQINAMDILYAIKFYADRNADGFSQADYDSIVSEIKSFFPEIEDIESVRTELDISSLNYLEFGKKLDILYSGAGLKHFLDVLIKTTLSGANILLLDEPEMGLHPDLQRRFIEYLFELAKKKNIQVFIATHSPVLLNYTDNIQCYRIASKQGKRQVQIIPAEANHLLLNDLGLRPSDVFNHDICIMVEGQADIIFFEHVLREIYKDDFKGAAIAVIQYGGDAAASLSSGILEMRNITSAQRYTLWMRDRDAMPDQQPSETSRKFSRALQEAGAAVHITLKREVEFYYPLDVHLKAQQGNADKEDATRSIFQGRQDKKYRKAAAQENVCVPQGRFLKKLLKENLTSKAQLDQEIRNIFEQRLSEWRREILG